VSRCEFGRRPPIVRTLLRVNDAMPSDLLVSRPKADGDAMRDGSGSAHAPTWSSKSQRIRGRSEPRARAEPSNITPVGVPSAAGHGRFPHHVSTAGLAVALNNAEEADEEAAADPGGEEAAVGADDPAMPCDAGGDMPETGEDIVEEDADADVDVLVCMLAAGIGREGVRVGDPTTPATMGAEVEPRRVMGVVSCRIDMGLMVRISARRGDSGGGRCCLFGGTTGKFRLRNDMKEQRQYIHR
jgi:hypothetical protein